MVASNFKQIRGLQGFAIILLLLYHCFPSLYKFGTGIGWIGVDLFLVLAGFIITNDFIDSRARKENITSLLKSYSLRYLPLYFVFLLLFFWVLPFVTKVSWSSGYSYYYEHQVWFWLMGSNILVAIQKGWPPVAQPVLDHFWLIAIIFQFGLVNYFVAFYLSQKQRIFTSFVFVVSSIVIRNLMVNFDWNYSVPYVFTFTRFDSLFIGALISWLLSEINTKNFLYKSGIWVFLISIFLLLALIFFSRSISLKNDYFIRYGYTVIALMFGSLIILLKSERFKWLNSFTSNSIFCWFGQYSFGIFLFHWFFQCLFADFINEQLAIIQIGLARSIVASIIGVGFIVFSAFISHDFFEKRFYLVKSK